MSSIRLGEELQVELIYEGERGQAFVSVQDKVQEDGGLV